MRHIKELLQKRVASQPFNLPNAGSVFRNPPGRPRGAPHRVRGAQGLRRRRRPGLAQARELRRERRSRDGARTSRRSSITCTRPCSRRPAWTSFARCASWGTADEPRTRRRADGRALGRARDLAHLGPCRARGAAQQERRRASVRSGRARALRPEARGLPARVHRAARAFRRGRHGAGRPRGAAHPVHRQRRDGLGVVHGQVAHQARVGRLGHPHAALRDGEVHHRLGEGDRAARACRSS